jgi:predicted enzyme related to lactoylglutathione lyase
MITFVPARNFEAAKRFYAELFEVRWQNKELCQFQAGGSSFLLQNYHQRDWAENSMYQLLVKDAHATWEQLQSSGVLTRHDNVRANPPKQEPWGKVVFLWGPSGELWHITEPDPA